MKSLTLVLALAVGTVLALGTPAWSDKKKEKDSDVSALVKDAKITIDQAIKTAIEKVPGTAVEAELEKKHDKTIWEVEIVGADGKVTEVCIDAVTGSVIDTESKDKKDEKKKEGKKGK
ncbi:MAG: PepSY domain-containing protein [Nitrospira sp.]